MITGPKNLLSRRFVVLNVIILLVFGNMAVFCDFYLYMKTLQIPEETFGLLIGAFNLTALVLRPIVSMYIHRRNALIWMFTGILFQAAALMAYRFALSFGLLLAVRVCHGLSYVTLLAACMTLLIDVIPDGRSAHAFSLVSVTTLIPFVLVPPLNSYLSVLLGGYTHLLACFGVLALAAIPLLMIFRSGGEAAGASAGECKALGWLDMKENVRNYPVLVALLATFFFYCIYAIILYYINSYATGKGFVHNGLYLTVTSISMIVIRICMGPFFDRIGRLRLTSAAMLIMIASCYALVHVNNMKMFLVIAVFTGVSCGMAVPLLTAMICDLSKPRFRAFNVNLSSEVTDGGFFTGPALGGFLLTMDSGYMLLFLSCAVFAVAVLLCLPFMRAGEMKVVGGAP